MQWSVKKSSFFPECFLKRQDLQICSFLCCLNPWKGTNTVLNRTFLTLRANAPARTPMQLLLVYVKHTIYSQSQPNSGNFIRAQISFLQKFMIMLIFRRPKWGLIQGEVPRFRHRLHPYIRPVAMGSFRAVSLKCCAQSKNLSILKTHVPPQTVKDPLKIFESSGGVLRW